jgi:hypothetical protein
MGTGKNGDPMNQRNSTHPLRYSASRTVRALCTALLSVAIVSPASAAANYISGHISAFTTTPNGVLIMIDGGLPTNCAGTPFGWMEISSPTPMAALVLGVWLRGDASTTVLTVFTAGIGGDGYCAVNQVSN